MVRMVLGIFIAICGVINIPADPGNGVLCIVFGAALAYWGRYARKKKEAGRVAAVQNEIAGYVAASPDPTASDTFTFEVTGVTHECRFSSMGRRRQDVMDGIHIGDKVYLKQYEWQGKPAFAVMDPKTNEDIGVAPRGCVKPLLKLVEKYSTSGMVVSKRNFEYKGDYYTGCEVRIDCMDK